MAYEIYTPGHGLVTDSLIMHGIVRLYDVSEIERVGDRYRILLNSVKPRRDVLSLLREGLDIYFNNKEAISNSSILGKIIDANVNIAVTTNWMSYLEEAIDKANFDNLMSVYTQDHRDRFNEGRSKSKSLFTLFLPLSFIHGKFSQMKYSVEEKEYRVCATCFSLINIGLIYGTVVLRYDSQDKSSVAMLTIIPADRMTREDLLLAQRFTRGSAIKLKADLSLKAIILYTFSVGEVLFTTNANPLILAWKVENNRVQLRSTGSDVLELNDILRKIAKIKLEYPAFPKLVLDLSKTEEGATTLHRLAHVILTGSDPSVVLKEITMLARNGLLSRSVINDLGGLAKALE